MELVGGGGPSAAESYRDLSWDLFSSFCIPHLSQMLWTATLSFITVLLMTLGCRNLPLHNRLMNSFSPCNKQCVHDVKSSMTHNKLKLNGYTTEALIRSAPRISNSVPLLDSLTAGNSTVRFSQSAKYCGVTLDMHLTMTAHVVNPDQNC